MNGNLLHRILKRFSRWSSNSMNFKSRINELVKDIRKKHFPGIRYVIIIHQKKTDYYMAQVALPFGRVLYVDRICKKMPADAVKALIVHELAHRLFDDERACDRKVIELGYANELLSFHDWHNTKFKRYKKSEGLTRKEIADLMRKQSI